jgi:hypothetical protein
MATIPKKESEKIGGYDRWKVQNAVRTLRESEEFKDDPKFLKVVLAEMDKEADKTDKAAAAIRNASKNLKKVFDKKGGE